MAGPGFDFCHRYTPNKLLKVMSGSRRARRARSTDSFGRVDMFTLQTNIAIVDALNVVADSIGTFADGINPF
jgi:hypothetical protein